MELKNNIPKGYAVLEFDSEGKKSDANAIFPSEIQELFNNFAKQNNLTQKDFATYDDRNRKINDFDERKLYEYWSKFISLNTHIQVYDNMDTNTIIAQNANGECTRAYRCTSIAEYYLTGKRTLESKQKTIKDTIRELFKEYRNEQFEKSKKDIFKKEPNLLEYIKILRQLFPTWQCGRIKHNIFVFTELIENLLYKLGYKEAQYRAGWFFLQSLKTGGNGKSLLQKSFYTILVNFNAPVERIALAEPKWGNIAFRDNMFVLIDDITIRPSNKGDYDKLIKNTADLNDGDTYTVNIKGGEIFEAQANSINLAATNSELNFENTSKYQILYYYNGTDFRARENQYLKNQYCVSEEEYVKLLKRAIEVCPLSEEISKLETYECFYKEKSIPSYVIEFRDMMIDVINDNPMNYNANRTYSAQGLKKIFKKVFNKNTYEAREIFENIILPATKWLHNNRDDNNQRYIRVDNVGGGYNPEYAQYFYGTPNDYPTYEKENKKGSAPEKVLESEIYGGSLTEKLLAKTRNVWDNLIAEVEKNEANKKS